ncbi:MAG: hypothetical protein GY856_42370, partial [bacterium]|nr:hypothetical protein [bacterium]
MSSRTDLAKPPPWRVFALWNVRFPSVGALAVAAFWLAVGSGAALILPFEPAAAADSLQVLLITNPAGVYFRAVHYWSGQLFLVLSAVHVIEHLAQRTERRVRKGVWLRLVVSVPVAGYLMLSGYILKGDAEGELARQVLAGLIERLPLLSAALHDLLVGADGDLGVIYLQHAATASVLTLVFIIEHARRFWPSAAAWLLMLGACSSLALLLPPGLHDAADPVVKGPWYMLGTQELLHWLPAPGLLWAAGGAWLALLAVLPWLDPVRSGRVKAGLGLTMLVYAVLVVIGTWFRGADWTWCRPLSPGDERVGISLPAYLSPAVYLPAPEAIRGEIPVVRGRREGCLPCHAEVWGFAPAHDPVAIGCSSCHLGNPWSGNAYEAHRGMVVVAGNLRWARQSCGAGDCHGGVVERVEQTLMATGRGMVAVDRFVFGEAPTPDGHTTWDELGSSPADSHLRELCASCHLGHVKEAPARVSELSRGGGCTACHLDYQGHNDNAYEEEKRHPALNLTIGDEHCFGCHSRSGRISTNYEGWHETVLEAAEVEGDPDYRVLEDGRVFTRMSADVHHRAGMVCVDCHTAREAMGDGIVHLHQEEQIEIACTDCHPVDAPRTLAWDELDEESRIILLVRHGEELVGRRFLAASKSGLALINVFLDAQGRPVLEGKLDGKRRRLLPPTAGCTLTLPGHEDLSCRSCHTAWAPQCLGCHTQRTRRGEWVEFAGTFLAGPPPLGVREEGGRCRVVPVIPGMIMTLNPEPAAVESADRSRLMAQGSFHRLFAPTAAHTTVKEGRSCAACHSDPLALGIGRGELVFRPTDAVPRWTFESTYGA